MICIASLGWELHFLFTDRGLRLPIQGDRVWKLPPSAGIVYGNIVTLIEAWCLLELPWASLNQFQPLPCSESSWNSLAKSICKLWSQQWQMVQEWLQNRDDGLDGFDIKYVRYLNDLNTKRTSQMKAGCVCAETICFGQFFWCFACWECFRPLLHVLCVA